jgi:anaerobic magnesium-protoporphyrin IX monomethyl ester cyclase
MNKDTRIVLINPPSPFLIEQNVMPPLGIWYMKSSLEADGFNNVDVYDLGIEDLEIPDEYDVYGITATSPQWPEAVALAQKLRSRQKILMVGGAHVGNMPHDGVGAGFDYVIVGEGEKAIQSIEIGKSDQVVYMPRHRNLDELPFPDRSQTWRYSYYVGSHNATTMMTSRGCPFSCSFCCKGIWGKKYMERSSDNVIQEVDQLMQGYGYEAIMFFDDTITINKNRLKELCQGFNTRGLVWRSFTRANQLDHDTAKRMADSGCYEIGVGVETGSEMIAQSIQKGETIEEQKQGLLEAKRAGLRVKVFIIVGLPGESWETIEETERFLDEMQPDDLDISILSVYAGSDIFKNPTKYDLTFGEPTFYKGKPMHYEAHISTSSMTGEEILQAREKLYNKFKKIK